jgi:hypothetical protein
VDKRSGSEALKNLVSVLVEAETERWAEKAAEFELREMRVPSGMNGLPVTS